jgi:nucleotide-binding universal stress UspA family protein
VIDRLDILLEQRSERWEQMFTRVLVAVEDAAQAPQVVAVAKQLAKQGSLHVPLQVTLMHATTHLLGSARVHVSSDDLERLTEQLRVDGVDARYLLEFEKPERGIVDAAAHVCANLIVLMPHGRQGLDALLHRSVTAQLLASGTAPLLLWPDRLPDIYAQDLLSLPDAKIILPLDGKPLAERALPYAIDLANAYERSLLLMRVIPDMPPPLVTMGTMGALGGGAYAPADLPRVEQEEAQAYLTSVAQRYTHDTITSIETMTLRGAPAHRILEAANAHPSSLLVMSTHGRGAVGRATVGSVTSTTAQDATMPILVIPPHAPAPLARTAPLKRPMAVGG